MRALVLAAWASSLVPSALAGCEGEDMVTLYPVKFAVEKPYDVSAYCPENTVFVVEEDLVITVTNAPTTVITQVTKTEWASTMIEG